MGGFDNGTIQGGVFAQAKQFGAILRGFGPPAPQAGVVGDVYIDVQTWLLYAKRETQGSDPWGDWLFQVPAMYRSTLKWFSASLPANDVGVDDDYCLLWCGFDNYGVEPSVFGPKVDGCWPESGTGPTLLLDVLYAGYELPVGLDDEGTPTAYSSSTQLIVAGLSDEYVLAIPVLQTANQPVDELGLLSLPPGMDVEINPLYPAIDVHPV